MKEINGYKYSKKEFDGYKFRSIFRLSVDEDWRNDTNIDVYTDNPDREEVKKVINSLTTDKVKNCFMEHWTTKEQDDRNSELIEETLKDI